MEPAQEDRKKKIMSIHSVSCAVGANPITIETGKIARLADGALRDGLSLLDQCVASGGAIAAHTNTQLHTLRQFNNAQFCIRGCTRNKLDF